MINSFAMLRFMDHLFTFFRRGRFDLFPHRPAPSVPVPSGQPPQSAPVDLPDPLPGRELMFTLIRDHMTMQHQVADQQDTKAAGFLVGGTTMAGFAFLIQHHPVGNCSALIPIWLHHWPIIVRLALPYALFLICYILAMIFALQASRIRGYWTVPDPVQALKSMNESEKELKLSLSKAMVHYSKLNELILDTKANWIRWAARLLLGEIATLVLLLFYQTVC